jgi:hypothetical protein
LNAHTESAAENAAEIFALRLILDHVKMAGSASWMDIATESGDDSDDEADDDVPDLHLVFHELAMTAAAAMIRGAETPEASIERATREIEDMLAEVLDGG